MASWMIHLRVAEGVIKHLEDVDKEKFIVGNIGPDCGEVDKDGYGYIPPVKITHWCSGKDKKSIDDESFYKAYLNKNISRDKYAFYLGYYTHLITDILWGEQIFWPIMDQLNQEKEKNKDSIKAINKDWNDLDHLFLEENPNFEPIYILKKSRTFPNIYFKYYSEEAIENKIKEISEYYGEKHEDLDRVYTYLTKQEKAKFVEKTVESIVEKLKEKHII